MPKRRFESAVALLAGSVRGWLNRSGKKFNRVCGAMFALFGAGLAAGS